jgi:hypothetical protein
MVLIMLRHKTDASHSLIAATGRERLSHVSRLTSHVSRLTSHVSRLTSHVSRLTSHVSRLYYTLARTRRVKYPSPKSSLFYLTVPFRQKITSTGNPAKIGGLIMAADTTLTSARNETTRTHGGRPMQDGVFRRVDRERRYSTEPNSRGQGDLQSKSHGIGIDTLTMVLAA